MLICHGFVHYNGAIYRKRVAFFAMLILISIFLSAFSLAEKRRWKHSRLVFVLICIIAGGFCFQYITCAVSDYVISLRYIPLMLSLSAVVYIAVWLIAGDSRTAAIWYYWIMLIAGYGYECIYFFRGVTFKPMDIFSIGTAMAVAGNYNYPLEAKHLFWFQGGILLWAMSGWVRQQKNKKCERKIKLVTLAVSTCWIWLLVSSNLLSSWHVVATAFESDAPYYNRIQGTLTTLMKECQQLSNIRPSNYSVNKLKSVDQRLSNISASSCEFRPNVLIIMNESLADLTQIWEINCTVDPLKEFRSLQPISLSGNLLVSAYGGSTCNTEHSFLTSTIPTPQLNMALYSSVRSETPSLAWQLKRCDYSTIAIHPNSASNYQRDKVYPALGFDRFISIKDFEDSETIRGLVSDRACYEKIMELFEQKTNEERLFVFNVTMQNHGGYKTGQLPLKTALVQETANTELEMYLNLIVESDVAFQELTAYFAKQAEPTIILMFGDHQPNLDMRGYPLQNRLSEVHQTLAQYTTPFIIWANYPIKTGYVDAISVNYLAPLLLQTAGLPTTAYDEWLLETAKDYPVTVLSGYSDSAGQFTSWEEAEWPERLMLMDHMRYNRLYDADNRLPALDLIR